MQLLQIFLLPIGLATATWWQGFRGPHCSGKRGPLMEVDGDGSCFRPGHYLSYRVLHDDCMMHVFNDTDKCKFGGYTKTALLKNNQCFHAGVELESVCVIGTTTLGGRGECNVPPTGPLNMWEYQPGRKLEWSKDDFMISEE